MLWTPHQPSLGQEHLGLCLAFPGLSIVPSAPWGLSTGLMSENERKAKESLVWVVAVKLRAGASPYIQNRGPRQLLALQGSLEALISPLILLGNVSFQSETYQPRGE